MIDMHYIKTGEETVFISPRILLAYLPKDLQASVCASLGVESLEDDSLSFGYSALYSCYTVSSSFTVGVSAKSEV